MENKYGRKFLFCLFITLDQAMLGYILGTVGLEHWTSAVNQPIPEIYLDL